MALITVEAPRVKSVLRLEKSPVSRKTDQHDGVVEVQHERVAASTTERERTSWNQGVCEGNHRMQSGLGVKYRTPKSHVVGTCDRPSSLRRAGCINQQWADRKRKKIVDMMQ